MLPCCVLLSLVVTEFSPVSRADPEVPIEVRVTNQWTSHQRTHSLYRLPSVPWPSWSSGSHSVNSAVGALTILCRQGKVKYLGISECSAATLRRAHAVHPIAAVEVEYSPFTLDIEDEKIGLLKTARELGVAIVAYAPLGRGFLTGRYVSCTIVSRNHALRLHYLAEP